nr:MAG TPA: hypothetical protein [Crassvirales sp.]DAW87528.1 MAG TPA: hypothetical protein [Bacteriophage sp.]
MNSKLIHENVFNCWKNNKLNQQKLLIKIVSQRLE